MPANLETPRLILRELKISDLTAVFTAVIKTEIVTWDKYTEPVELVYYQIKRSILPAASY